MRNVLLAMVGLMALLVVACAPAPSGLPVPTTGTGNQTQVDPTVTGEATKPAPGATVTPTLATAEPLTPTTEISATLVVSSTGEPAPPAAPTPSDMPSDPLNIPTPEANEQVYVNEVEPSVTEAQVTIIVRGDLPDGCTTIKESRVEQMQNTLMVRIFTDRPADMMCTDALVPFEITVAVDRSTLADGNYTISAYGVEVPLTVGVASNPAESERLSCVAGADETVFTAADNSYCFVIPAGFELTQVDVPGMVLVSWVGERGPSNMQATMSITTKPAGGLALPEYVAQDTAEIAQNIQLEQINTNLTEGTPSIVIENMPGLIATRAVYAVQNDVAYVLTFTPNDAATFPDATAQMETLYARILNSWDFAT